MLLHMALLVKTIPDKLRTNNRNIRIENANTLTPKPITTQEAIISVIASTIKSIGQTLTYCKFINHKSLHQPNMKL